MYHHELPGSLIGAILRSIKRNDITITPAFIDALDSVPAFCFEMNPDIDMAYDYVCEQAGIGSFVDNKEAWDMFYDVWEKIAEDNFVNA